MAGESPFVNRSREHVDVHGFDIDRKKRKGLSGIDDKKNSSFLQFFAKGFQVLAESCGVLHVRCDNRQGVSVCLPQDRLD